MASAVGLSALLLGGCATQHQTAQALTIAGAAAVIVGASMAADSECYDVGEGAVEAYCSPRLGKSGRNVGKGVAVAGVGLAAAGYALTPKGPDNMRRLRSDPAPPSSPYRLIRHDPPPEAAPAGLAVPEPAPASASAVAVEPAPPAAAEAPPPAPCRPEGSAAPSEPCSPAATPPAGAAH